MNINYEEMLKKAVQNLPARTETRFETPVASVSVGKRQTIIKNFSDIAKVLRRGQGEIAKYLFKELAVPGEIRGAELVLQAKVPTPLINQRIKEYVRDFVLCKECGKPDTVLQKMDNYIFIKCEACGAKRPVR
ncbi:MAG: translation initiation factor IF-2 subunit beta [Candidatus Aenigmarchaeota archaeon]|nr:translation initiation factor IF-2 subunit beta [Candidatus Aenigmarchaeota archaeon]